MNLIVAVRDTLAGAFVGGVHLYPNDAAAIRFFSDVCADPQTLVHRHLNDHELVQLGSVDINSGAIAPCEPRVLLTGAQWKAAQAES